MQAPDSFLDEHVDWLLSLGIEPHSGPSPYPAIEAVTTAAPRTWPDSLVEWYDARLWDRFYELQSVGLPNFGRLAPPMAPVTFYDDFRRDFDQLTERGLFPIAPAPFWSDESNLTVVAETSGPRAGSLYWFDFDSMLHGAAGLLCVSIPDYLQTIRALHSAGVSSPHEEPPWATASWQPQHLDAPCPPLDTPGPIVGFPWPTIGEGIPGLTNPVASSIVELLGTST